MTKKKTMKNIKTPNKFNIGGLAEPITTPESVLGMLNKLTASPTVKPGELVQTWDPNFKSQTNTSGFFKGADFKNAAGALGGLAGGLISGGFSTTGGQILSGIGDAAMMFNPIIGGAIKVASGLVNRGFGTKWDQEGIAKAEGQIEGLNSFQSGASDYDTLAQDFTRIGSMNKTIKASDLGKDGWFVDRTTNKANELNTELGNAYNYAMRNANNVANNIASSTLANLERNYAAFGGPLFAYGGQTHGSDFTNGLMFINNGGTHESNPYEGVPISMDKEGNPNLVEEGEVIWNDYVFSNRLKVPKSIQKKYKLGKREMTFADAVNKLSKESEERPNDPISIRSLEKTLTGIAMEQEQIRARKPKENNKFNTGGPYIPYSYISGYNNGWFGNDGKYTKEYLDYVNSITKNQMLSAFNDNFAYYSDNKNKGTDRYKAIEAFYKSNPAYAKQLSELSDEMFNTSKGLMTDYKPGYMHHIAATMMNRATPIKGPIPTGLTSKPTLNIQSADLKGLPVGITTQPQYKEETNINNLPTWMRYAPAIGYGALALTDMLGITNKPDYSNADAIIKASNNISNNTIEFKPIGDYLTYNPFDTEYHANQLRAVSGSTRRNIMNTSRGNRATAMADLLAADYNTMNQMGDLYRNAAEYNLEQKHKVADFNRATNITNSEGFLKASMANQSAKHAGLEGLIKGYSMKEQAKLMSDQAKANNLSGLFTSLGNIGYENANRNMMNWGMANGVWAPSQWKYDPLTGKEIKYKG